MAQRTGKPNQCQCLETCKKPALAGAPFCKEHNGQGKCPRISPLSGSEPRYEPEKWNTKGEITDTHNCFSYSMNVNDPKQIAKCKGKKFCNAPFHQPGAAAGHRRFSGKTLKTCPDMRMRILGDNPHISMTSFEAKCPPKTSKIALVVDPSDDYHFFRQDSNGYWSHKPGARNVTNVDAGKHTIWDPRLADLDYRKDDSVLNYNIFCSYMCVPRGKALYLKPSEGGGSRGIPRNRHRTRRLLHRAGSVSG